MLTGLALFPIWSNAAIKHVIYITFDGVRWQDIYQHHENFPSIWLKHAKHLTFYGQPESDSTMEAASVPVSLPSYQSQMAGVVQACENNECGRIQVETLPEGLLRKLRLQKKQVATFASWNMMRDAVESTEGTTYTNLGNAAVSDPDTQQSDPVMAGLNTYQDLDDPGKGDRYDNYTLAQSLHYFQVYKPTFMWISLALTDTAGHMDDIGLYKFLLRYYDEALDRLFDMLQAEHLDQDTMVIVTTDHGRGNNDDWKSHGPAYPESKQTWAFVYNGRLKPMSIEGHIKHYSTLSIRPTIESALES